MFEIFGATGTIEETLDPWFRMRTLRSGPWVIRANSLTFRSTGLDDRLGDLPQPFVPLQQAPGRYDDPHDNALFALTPLLEEIVNTKANVPRERAAELPALPIRGQGAVCASRALAL